MVTVGREWEGWVPASSAFSDKMLDISCDCMSVYEWQYMHTVGDGEWTTYDFSEALSCRQSEMREIDGGTLILCRLEVLLIHIHFGF